MTGFVKDENFFHVEKRNVEENQMKAVKFPHINANDYQT